MINDIGWSTLVLSACCLQPHRWKLLDTVDAKVFSVGVQASVWRIPGCTGTDGRGCNMKLQTILFSTGFWEVYLWQVLPSEICKKITHTNTNVYAIQCILANKTPRRVAPTGGAVIINHSGQGGWWGEQKVSTLNKYGCARTELRNVSATLGNSVYYYYQFTREFAFKWFY